MGRRGSELPVDDLRVPEPRVAEQGIEGVEQRLIATPVDQ